MYRPLTDIFQVKISSAWPGITLLFSRYTVTVMFSEDEVPDYQLIYAVFVFGDGKTENSLILPFSGENSLLYSYPGWQLFSGGQYERLGSDQGQWQDLYRSPAFDRFSRHSPDD
jgi:hypothetical protein